jgi:DNA-directed RNA polymerase subunit omega
VRNDYLQSALLVIDDPNVLVNMVSRRVKQLKQGNRALVESLEKLAPEDIALREIAEKKISFEEASAADIIAGKLNLMAKSQNARKQTKKPAKQSPKQKKAAKRAKK